MRWAMDSFLCLTGWSIRWINNVTECVIVELWACGPTGRWDQRQSPVLPVKTSGTWLWPDFARPDFQPCQSHQFWPHFGVSEPKSWLPQPWCQGQASNVNHFRKKALICCFLQKHRVWVVAHSLSNVFCFHPHSFHLLSPNTKKQKEKHLFGHFDFSCLCFANDRVKWSLTLVSFCLWLDFACCLDVIDAKISSRVQSQNVFGTLFENCY